VFAAVSLMLAAAPAFADVISDWNEKASAFLTSKNTPPPVAERTMAMVNVAMFDAVNAIEKRYRPYLSQPSALPTLSKNAAAATAAGTVLSSLYAAPLSNFNAEMATYLDNIPDDGNKSTAVELGKAVAAEILAARTGDGSDLPDSYRPKTKPGTYVPTAAVWSSMWPKVKPFAIPSASHFRPIPPIALTSQRWADNYNEIKVLGARDSARRSPQQTETARFWLTIGPAAYYPIVTQLVAAKKLDILDSARFFTLIALARADAFISVFDAKYHYEFWRPITAIRNGDIDDNQATLPEPNWLPIVDTPMHPEYPCAHCIVAAAFEAVTETVFGSVEIPEVTATSPTAPGAVHRWANLRVLTEEVSNARIWAGFHYRFSAEVAADMGRKIGRYVAETRLQSAIVGTAQK
jgi:hypothetical protein